MAEAKTALSQLEGRYHALQSQWSNAKIDLDEAREWSEADLRRRAQELQDKRGTQLQTTAVKLLRLILWQHLHRGLAGVVYGWKARSRGAIGCTAHGARSPDSQAAELETLRHELMEEEEALVAVEMTAIQAALDHCASRSLPTTPATPMAAAFTSPTMATPLVVTPTELRSVRTRILQLGEQLEDAHIWGNSVADQRDQSEARCTALNGEVHDLKNMLLAAKNATGRLEKAACEAAKIASQEMGRLQGELIASQSRLAEVEEANRLLKVDTESLWDVEKRLHEAERSKMDCLEELNALELEMQRIISDADSTAGLAQSCNDLSADVGDHTERIEQAELLLYEVLKTFRPWVVQSPSTADTSGSRGSSGGRSCSYSIARAVHSMTPVEWATPSHQATSPTTPAVESVGNAAVPPRVMFEESTTPSPQASSQGTSAPEDGGTMAAYVQELESGVAILEGATSLLEAELTDTQEHLALTVERQGAALMHHTAVREMRGLLWRQCRAHLGILVVVWRTNSLSDRGTAEEKLREEACRLEQGWSDAGLALESLSSVMEARLSTAEAARTGMQSVLRDALVIGENATLEADELRREVRAYRTPILPLA